MTRVLNFALYQVGWFACVLGAAWSRPITGSIIALTLVGVHLLLTTQPVDQIKLLCMAWGIGLIVDTTLLQLGVYQFPSEEIVAGLPPPWMSVLWIQFATILRYCLRWLSGRYLLSSALAFFGAPLAFLGGERLGAIQFLDPRLPHLLLLALLWGVAIPLLILVSDRIHATAKEEASYRGF